MFLRIPAMALIVWSGSQPSALFLAGSIQTSFSGKLS
jgi:hypothetical protein